ncbi:hypothetical protein AA313_de0208436 [Arthrobotrys entomopaga]|nr:hypothetical protein AA313_de0208436 [Arthrobotrys entomopaga]
MTDTQLSLRQLLDSSNLPSLVLDFRLRGDLEDPLLGRVQEVKVLHNAACTTGEYSLAVSALMQKRLENDINERTQYYSDENGSWLAFSLGHYNIWTFNPNSKFEDRPTQLDKYPSQASSENVLVHTAVSTREEQLYSRLDNIQSPLKSFSDLSNQALKDVETARKDLSSLQDTIQLDSDLSERISSRLLQVELNLRTITSGLSLLKDLSDISDLTPPKPEPSPRPAENLSDKDLLTSIRSRVHMRPTPSVNPLNPWITYYKPPEELQAHVPTLRLLLVEDNVVNQKIMYKFSQKFGVLEEFITQAFDGQEALDCLERMARVGQFPDIIMIDCVMPVMDGYTFLEEFWKRWPNARCKIVGLTVHAMKGYDERFKSLGVKDIMFKPLRFYRMKSHMEAAARLKMTREIEYRGKL